LPMLEREYAPGLTGRLVELAGEMRAFDDFINRQVKSELRCRAGHGRLRIAGFSELHPVVASGLLRGFLRDESGDLRGIHRHDIESLRHLCSTSCGDGIVTLPRGWRVRREYDMAIMERAEQDPTAPFALPLAPEGETKVDGANFVFDASVTAGDRLMQTVSTLARSKPMEAAFDLDQIRGALRIRSFQLGDRVRPLGMNGTRKVHDVFVDAKLPRRQRQAWPLVVADDEILWIPGMVRSVMAPVTSATKNLLFVRARQQNNEEMARCL